jgi:hypothetical protein
MKEKLHQTLFETLFKELKNSNQYFKEFTMSATTVGCFRLFRPASSGSSVQGTANRLVLLFGWSDSQMRHLEKYTSIYHTLGLDVYVMTSPSVYFLSSGRLRKDLRRNDEEAVKHLLEAGAIQSSAAPKENRNRKVIVHVFSNGGLLAFRGFFRLLAEKQPPLRLNLSHFIFDSVPGATARTGGIALTMWIKNRIVRTIVSSVVTAWFFLSGSVRYLLGFNSLSTIDDLKQFTLEPQQLAASRLYMYSKVDDLVPAEQIQAHALAAQKKGCDVYEHVFEDSAHVQHFRKFPELYRTAVHEFLNTPGITTSSVPRKL